MVFECVSPVDSMSLGRFPCLSIDAWDPASWISRPLLSIQAQLGIRLGRSDDHIVASKHVGLYI